MKNFELRSAQDIANLVDDWGFLPFFANDIAGFSIEEHCPAELWFSDVQDGPWEWKAPVMKLCGGMYGKLFRGKAGYVSRAWLPHFANFRRDGYDFDSRVDEGIAPEKDCYLYSTVESEGRVTSRRLKQLCNYSKTGNRGFETVMTRLQMQTYICISDFVYDRDKLGRPYGWGVAEYSTPESLLGEDSVRSAYCRKPEKSYELIFEHLKSILQNASEQQISKFLGM